MRTFVTLTGATAYLPIANIDTDMIIPKQYLKTIARTGLGRWLFAAMRYDSDGRPRPDFVLNREPPAQILLAGENFGCGSSREHAPWALYDFGIRAVIAPGFADIFYNNCCKNGLLPVRLDAAAIRELAQAGAPVTIDLRAQTVACGDRTYSFAIESGHKDILLNGLDPIALVLKDRGAIEDFERRHFASQPWLRTGEQGRV